MLAIVEKETKSWVPDEIFFLVNSRISHAIGACFVWQNRDFKNPGRGESETRPEVTFPVSDEERMRLAFSPALENAAWRDLASSGKREYLALLLKANHYNYQSITTILSIGI